MTRFSVDERRVTGGSAYEPRPTGLHRLSGNLILASLFIHLAGTKWGSYLPTPVQGLYLPDLLTVTGCIVALVGARGGPTFVRLPRPLVWVGLTAAAYVAVRALTAAGDATNWTLWLRDMAPYCYLALAPLVGLALTARSFRALLRTVRAASTVMAITVAGHLSGLLVPIDLGMEQPLLSPRWDADAVVLGLGMIAFGDWGDNARPRRMAQFTLLGLAGLSYSRAGLLAVLFCACVALLRERKLGGPRVLMTLIVAGIVVVGASLIAVSSQLGMGPGTPQSVDRLLASDLGVGTTGARLAAWGRLTDYTINTGAVWTGSGPAEQPVLLSGAVAYLSGASDVRAPHNWLVGAFAYHGIVGACAWLGGYLLLLRRFRRTPESAGTAAMVGAYAIAGTFGVIVESPFGSSPMMILSTWTSLLGNRSVTRGTQV